MYVLSIAFRDANPMVLLNDYAAIPLAEAFASRLMEYGREYKLLTQSVSKKTITYTAGGDWDPTEMRVVVEDGIEVVIAVLAQMPDAFTTIIFYEGEEVIWPSGSL